MMAFLNGCSKKSCPFQVGAADNCTLTEEQCPYFTQDIDYHRVFKQIKVEVAREIFDEIERTFKGLLNGDISNILKLLSTLKKEYVDQKLDEAENRHVQCGELDRQTEKVGVE